MHLINNFDFTLILPYNCGISPPPVEILVKGEFGLENERKKLYRRNRRIP